MSPIYEFRCKKCDRVFDLILPSPEEEVECECGEKATRTWTTRCSVKFNCDGFHKTDYTKYERKDQTSKEFYEWKEKAQKYDRDQRTQKNYKDIRKGRRETFDPDIDPDHSHIHQSKNLRGPKRDSHILLPK